MAEEEKTVLSEFVEWGDNPIVTLGELTTPLSSPLSSGYYTDLTTGEVRKSKFPEMQCVLVEGAKY